MSPLCRPGAEGTQLSDRAGRPRASPHPVGRLGEGGPGTPRVWLAEEFSRQVAAELLKPLPVGEEEPDPPSETNGRGKQPLLHERCARPRQSTPARPARAGTGATDVGVRATFGARTGTAVLLVLSGCTVVNVEPGLTVVVVVPPRTVVVVAGIPPRRDETVMWFSPTALYVDSTGCRSSVHALRGSGASWVKRWLEGAQPRSGIGACAPLTRVVSRLQRLTPKDASRDPSLASSTR
jgi:hypothetical protein